MSSSFLARRPAAQRTALSAERLSTLESWLSARSSLSEITPKDVERALWPKHAPATRNRALCAFRGLFGWAVRQGLLEKDPTSGMPKEHETARTRVLSDEEIRTLINGFNQTRYGRALRLLFLTGLRRDEVLGLKWSWIDLERGVLTIPPSAEKTGRVREELRRTGLPPQAVALLAEQRAALFAEGIRSEHVFATSTGERPHPDSLKPILYRLRGRRSNGWPPSKDKRAKQRNAVLPDDVNIHDIRRTVADALPNRIGLPPGSWTMSFSATLGPSSSGPTCRRCRSARPAMRCRSGARRSRESWVPTSARGD